MCHALLHRPAFLIGIVVILSGHVVAGDGLSRESQVDFATEIQPIFAKRCAVCHGPDQQEAGLNLTDEASVFSTLDSGERAIVAGSLDASEVWQRVTSSDPDLRMPPEGKPLGEEQLDRLQRWIAGGAKWTAHWAYRPLRQPAIAPVTNKAWCRTPIDALILADLEAAGITPAAAADKAALIRRLTYDLTGLPPEPEKVREFLSDARDEAYVDLVERLLASPHYGEHWARHWLDLVRYGESDGYERDNPKPEVWRYRDYVIRSFNNDKPYDQFIREQLAGDESPHPSADEIIATGFYRLGLWDDEPVDALQSYYDHLDDVVTTTSHTFLAMTINCARCHDHKIDPIPQHDYYRFLSFFHNILNNIQHGEYEDFAFTLNTLREIASPEERQRYDQQSKMQQEELRKINRLIENLSQKVVAEFSRPQQEDAVDPNTRRRLVDERLADVLSEEELTQWRELHQRLETVTSQQPAPLPTALAVQENGNQAPTTHVLLRGNARNPGDEVVPGFPQVLGGQNPNLPNLDASFNYCGRRTVLANWIASSENPLTARVIVNRVWQQLFRRGIVESSSDFGLQGTPPTHPELLDWLATEFVNRGWSIKALLRLILTSSSYQMSAHPHAVALSKDPSNRLLSRQNMRRLNAEEVRDSMLAVSGQLNREQFGPSIYVTLAPEVLQGQSRPGHGWGESPIKQQHRRSIYIHVKRSLLVPLLDTFDLAEPDVSCPVRFSTTQPTQALALLNSDFANRQARHLAQRVRDEVGSSVERQVERTLWLVTQRVPTRADVQRGLDLLKLLDSDEHLDSDQALDAFCLLALNLNEFLFLD